MARYFIEFGYKGTAFNGWQKQPNGPSVQQLIESKLAVIFKKEIDVLGAGRTDTGVHATQMFAHFDIDQEFDCAVVARSLSALVGDQIIVYRVIPVADEAHARFDATHRKYEYWVSQYKSPFLIDRMHFLHQELNVEAMNNAASLLLGKKDFECFSKTNTQVNNFICDLREARWEEVKGGYKFHISANRFLRNMVRAIVGTLIEVGQGKLSNTDILEILASKNRSMAGTSVPACGLYLTEVHYPYIIHEERGASF